MTGKYIPRSGGALCGPGKHILRPGGALCGWKVYSAVRNRILVIEKHILRSESIFRGPAVHFVTEKHILRPESTGRHIM